MKKYDREITYYAEFEVDESKTEELLKEFQEVMWDVTGIEDILDYVAHDIVTNGFDNGRMVEGVGYVAGRGYEANDPERDPFSGITITSLEAA